MVVRQSSGSLGFPERIFITRSALKVMEDEARRHTDSELGENETGGILIGRRLDKNRAAQVLIVAATGPGEDALHHTLVFGPDVDYCNEKLDEYRQAYPRMDYIGTWHKHPRSFPSFSRGDVATAHEIFRDPSYQIDEIINPIVWVGHDQQIIIRYYYMNRDMAMQGNEFVEISKELVQIIDDDDDTVIGEQSLYGRLIEENKRFLAWGHPFDLKTTEDEYIFIIPFAEIPGLIIYLTVAEGYPRHPPNIVLEQDGQQLILKTETPKIITDWYVQPKRPYLVEVVGELTKTLMSLSPEERQQLIVTPISETDSAAPAQPDTPSPDSPTDSSAPPSQQQYRPTHESDEPSARRSDGVPTSPPAATSHGFSIGTYVPYLIAGGVVLLLLVLVVANRSSASVDSTALDNGRNADSAVVIKETNSIAPVQSTLASPTSASGTPIPAASPVPTEEKEPAYHDDRLPLDQIVPPARVTLRGVPTGQVNRSYAFIANVEQPVTTMPITYTWAATTQSPAVRATQALSDTIVFAWSNPGTYMITVEVHNRVGLVTDTHEIVILAEE